MRKQDFIFELDALGIYLACINQPNLILWINPRIELITIEDSATAERATILRLDKEDFRSLLEFEQIVYEYYSFINS